MSDYIPPSAEQKRNIDKAVDDFFGRSKPSLRERIREQLPQTTAEFRARLSIYAVETTGGQVSGFKRSEELAELFDLWLAEVKAQAWEEGAIHTSPCKCEECVEMLHNHYRQGETE